MVALSEESGPSRAPPPGPVCSRAAISDGRGSFVIEQTTVRAPAAGEVRVALRAAGICHTDHASLQWPGPLVLGHEGAGVVESVGAGVAHEHPELKPGQPVLLNWAIPCGRCPQCQRGRGSLCERTHGVDAALGSSAPAPGHTRWRGECIERSFKLGTFAEHSLVRAEALTCLPEGFPMTHAVHPGLRRDDGRGRCGEYRAGAAGRYRGRAGLRRRRPERGAGRAAGGCWSDHRHRPPACRAAARRRSRVRRTHSSHRRTTRRPSSWPPRCARSPTAAAPTMPSRPPAWRRWPCCR